MTHPRFETTAVIGTGMMGPGIALTFALGGARTTILSRKADTAQTGLGKALAQLDLLEQHSLTTAERAAGARQLLAASDAFDQTIARVDLVIESALENMAFKQDLFARMDSIARPEAVLATNTSGLSITVLASECLRPERVLTTHFWNPPHLMPLVEIVKGERTSPEVVSAVRQFLVHCGKVPVLIKKDTPGQLGNRLQIALMREAAYIVQEGIANAEDVDLAAKTGFGLRLPVYGVLEHMDMVGLDMVLGIADYVSQDLYNQPKAPDLIRNLVAQGNLGVKTGQGFFDWSQRDAEASKARRDRFVLEFLKVYSGRADWP